MRPSLRQPWLRQTFLLRWHPRAPQSIPRRIATTSAANAAPVDLPKLIITPGSVHHNSLPTFLEYAKRTNLAEDKTYYVGTHYEYSVALSLMRLGFSLLRIGRKFDAGIDLIGHWVLAPLREPLPVIIQCKARKISVSPSNIRELEGSFQGIPAEWRNKDVLGLLVTTKKATKGTLEALGQSRWPMGFVLIARDGTIQQFVWNRAASEKGLEGVGVTLRHTPIALLLKSEQQDAIIDSANPLKKRSAKLKTTGTRKDIQLTWMGSPIFPDRDNLDQKTLELMSTIKPSSDDISAGQYTYRVERDNRGRPRTAQKAPSPRGGCVTGKRGRPAKVGEEPVVAIVKKVERRGRPRGSKNKPKVVEDAG